MLEESCPFLYTKISKIPKIAPNTRFYICDPINSDSFLFIARSQYNDTLIQKLQEGFISIYRTELLERISSASAHASRRWYLITLYRYGDGIDPRFSYRSIFVGAHSNNSSAQQTSSSSLIPVDDQDSDLFSTTNLISDTEFLQDDDEDEKIFPNTIVYPISTRTFYPQYLSWNHIASSNCVLFTSFMNTIQILEIIYHMNSYKIIPRKSTTGFTFRSFSSQICSRTFSIESSEHQELSTKPNSKQRKLQCESPVFLDRRENDVLLFKYKLPSDLVISPQTEIRTFISNSRQKINDLLFPTKSDGNRLSVIRCLLFANRDSTTIVFPYSKISATFCTHNQKKSRNKEPNVSKAMNGHNKPASKLPFSVYLNEFIVIFAPYNYITIILIDNKDRLRASFSIEYNKLHEMNSTNEINLSNVFSINSKGSLGLNELTGDICKIDLNPLYFASKNVKFVIPILHYIINTTSALNFNQLVTNDLIEFLWNGEFFQEVLLLLFNEKPANQIFKETVCSTFCKEKHYSEFSNCFTQYRSLQSKDKPNEQGSKRHSSLSLANNDSFMHSDSILAPTSSDTYFVYQSLPLINQIITDDEITSTNDELSDVTSSFHEIIPKSSSSSSLSTPDGNKKKGNNQLPLPSTNRRLSIYRSTDNVRSVMLSPQPPQIKIDQSNSTIYGFSDIQLKAANKTMKSLKLNNISEFYDSLLSLMTGELFEVASYPSSIHFPVYMQLLSLKFLFCRKPISQFLKIDETFFKNNQRLSKSIKEMWSSYNFLNWDINWPQLDFVKRIDHKDQVSNNENDEVLRRWWAMRATKTVILEETISTPETSFFQVVEKVVTNHKMGKEIHELHLTMFDQDLYQSSPEV